MPFYDYRCQDCGRKVRLFLSYKEFDTVTPACTHCQGQQLKRLINRVSVAKSEDARMDSLMDDPALAGLDEEDPRALGKFMRKMSQEMGEEMPDEFNEVVGRLEKGESPDSIEESMPELADSMGGDSMGGMGSMGGFGDDF
ncbi:MAG: zinc ribbon domain-containing protein [Chloroflexi bacterium]|nr:zinc ribbon domain-containing protein [Chloroflexota bacterium]